MKNLVASTCKQDTRVLYTGVYNTKEEALKDNEDYCEFYYCKEEKYTFEVKNLLKESWEYDWTPNQSFEDQDYFAKRQDEIWKRISELIIRRD